MLVGDQQVVGQALAGAVDDALGFDPFHHVAVLARNLPMLELVRHCFVQVRTKGLDGGIESP